MLDTPFEQISSAIVWVACATAVTLGGRPERIGAAGVWLAWFTSVLTQVRTGWVDPQYVWIGIDSALFLLLAWLGLKSGRRWPVYAAACQFLMVGAHFAMALDLRIRSVAYLTTIAIWSLGVLVAMVIGALVEAKADRLARAARR